MIQHPKAPDINDYLHRLLPNGKWEFWDKWTGRWVQCSCDSSQSYINNYPIVSYQETWAEPHYSLMDV